jgi:hypothetical protein
MSNYEEHYNIRIFDELHNYFPEILYGNPNQFRTVTDLINYIRNQVRNRTDLFSNARRNNTRLVQQVNRVVPSNASAAQTDNIRVTFNMDDTVSMNDNELFTSLLSYILRAPPTSNFTDPVIVRPTQAQINAGTTIVSVTNTNELCAICQESLHLENTRVRKINHCSHMFHDNCISTWLNTNVHCPTCRHDIRVTNFR